MNSRPLTSRTYFTGLSLINALFLGGQLLFAVISVFVHTMAKKNASRMSEDSIFHTIVPVFTVLMLVAGFGMMRKQLSSLRELPALTEKLLGYRVPFLLRSALWQAGSLFAIAGYFVATDLFFLLYSGLFVLAFLITWPTRNRVSNDLELTKSERDKIENPEFPVA